MRRIVSGIDLEGKRVLDIGCGTGGPALVLARDFGTRLVCLDVEEGVLARARRLFTAEGVDGQVELVLAQPGPLPFGDSEFDIVFSKDSLIHIPDKVTLYQEILRVLRPGGTFVASDWLAGPGADSDPDFRKFIELAHLSFAMATAEETAWAMREAGFEDVLTADRCEWYASLATEEVAAIEGPLRDQIIEVSDPETYERWLGVRRQLAAAARSGGLRPTHLRGRRPG